MADTYIGIGLNIFSAQAIALRDDGKIIAKIDKKRSNVNANETIKVLVDLFEEIVSKVKGQKDNIKCVGLALGGIVNAKKGTVNFPQKQDSSYTYISLPLKDYLEKKFGIGVIIENDANACAYAEHQNNFSKCQNMLYMFSGVGCGMIIDGKLYHGRDGAAGEIFLNIKKQRTCSLGDCSFLSQWPADLGLIKQAKEAIALGQNSTLLKKINSQGELQLADIFEQAKNNDKLSCEIIKKAAFSLGVKIAFLVNFLNPEVVVIGGGIEDAGELFLDECSSTIKEFSFNDMRKNLNITFSKLGKDALALGAGLLAQKNLVI